MHKVFISYHHANDQWAKDHLQILNEIHSIFIDRSVNSRDIDDQGMEDEQIRVRVRDDYLRDASVTIVLVGTETRYRKHVDWELRSSMYDGSLNTKAGIILVPLPSTGMTNVTAAHGDEEKKLLFPEITGWTSLERKSYQERYPHFSARMIDNLVKVEAKISVIPWTKVENDPSALATAIEFAYRDRDTSEYDFSTLMRRRDGHGQRR